MVCASHLCKSSLSRSRRTERLFLFDVVGFDWNCPQYITPRYTETEFEALAAPLRTRIAELEAKLAAR